MDDYKDKLFHSANSKLFEFSKALRKNQTEAEEIMWQCLRNRKILNFKFRRQHPLHKYIADFYCPEAKLVIEVDGGIHEKAENQEYDQNRTDELKQIGITVIRFTNEDVNNNLDKVINVIKRYLSP
ncbi:endonuclease domain-containing protein [Pedobacter psychrodurus]|uniref:Endonuclease domain-containing protein n=1 Tax=Pedobacter psychrodurus TaxID=2530456 RepID=A0A4R0PUR0_9SPHI|nr:endonuclease domain-containing protein [Pedobacter psychrodurus]TCD26279.1 endonuclease domain-containing protein [Pedobacter psychrodurus]